MQNERMGIEAVEKNNNLEAKTTRNFFPLILVFTYWVNLVK